MDINKLFQNLKDNISEVINPTKPEEKKEEPKSENLLDVDNILSKVKDVAEQSMEKMEELREQSSRVIDVAKIGIKEMSIFKALTMESINEVTVVGRHGRNSESTEPHNLSSDSMECNDEEEDIDEVADKPCQPAREKNTEAVSDSFADVILNDPANGGGM